MQAVEYNFDRQTDVTFVVPVYNAEKYIKKCVDSILKQTFKNFRVILVDDGSTDSSGQICDWYANRDSRIFVIHQKNRGSVEARKAGILSKIAQDSSYIILCDADDTLVPDALEILFNMAKLYKADCVCGRTRKLWKGISYRYRWCPECFNISRERLYLKQEILNELYISCFGISNYPVTLYAKLYKTELLTRAIDFKPIVQFMGEDLSITLRCLPETERLVIIPDEVYNYRVGGLTSRFMPYMLDDFIALYQEKKILIKKYPMPQDARFYMDVELMNVLISWLKMCYVQGHYENEKFRDECRRVCNLNVIKEAAENLYDGKKNFIAKMVHEGKSSELEDYVYDYINKTKRRDFIVEILKKFQ